MADDKKKMTHAGAEELFAELIRLGDTESLRAIRRRACSMRITPVKVLVEYGDPREG